MLTPSIFGENLFDDWFDDFPFFDDRDLRKVDKKLYGRRAGNLMKTDIQEMKDGYKMEVDLPGFKKDEITVELDDQCRQGTGSGREGERIRTLHPQRALCRCLQPELLCGRGRNRGGYQG